MESQTRCGGAVQIDALSFSFVPGGSQTLQDVSLTLCPGARCVLVGHNGAGKSTLLEVIAGNKMVAPGQVLVCGEDPFRGSSGREVALVQGGWRRYADSSIEDRQAFMRVHELLGLSDAKCDAATLSEYSRRLLEALALKVLLDRYFGSLSDGERRRVELGRKLWERKSVVLLDEATTDLDVLARKSLMSFLMAESVTVVNATHVFDGLESWATHIAFLQSGRVVKFEEIGSSLWDEDSSMFGLVAKWLRASAPSSPAVPNITQASKDDQATGSIATVKYLKFAYDLWCPCALRLDSLALPLGCRCALVGLNGAGKSTFLSVLAGRRMVPNTDVQVFGFRPFYDHAKLDSLVTILSSEWKRQVADISAGKSITFAELAQSLIQQFMAAGIDQSVLSGRMLRLLQLLSIDPTKPIGASSDGMMRRAQIALKLLRPCKLLLVDEVTADLDVLARAALLDFLREESERGCSIIYCTHIFDGMQDWASHILRLRPGGHDGELIQLQNSASECDRTLLDTIVEMLTKDSALEPLSAPAVPDVKQGKSGDLPEGWEIRGATHAGAFGEHAWNADRGPEETWTFGSVAPKPQMQSGDTSSSAPSNMPFGQQAPFGGMQQVQAGYPGMSPSFDSCPSDWGSRSNQVPLNHLLQRGIVQPGREMPPNLH